MLFHIFVDAWCQVERVLKPGGALVVYGYGLCSLDEPAAQETLNRVSLEDRMWLPMGGKSKTVTYMHNLLGKRRTRRTGETGRGHRRQIHYCWFKTNSLTLLTKVVPYDFLDMYALLAVIRFCLYCKVFSLEKAVRHFDWWLGFNILLC